MDNVKKFYEALANDKEMQKRAQALNDTPLKDSTAITDTLLAFAKKEGYSFTADDLNSYLKSTVPQGKVSDEALAAVAGGQNEQTGEGDPQMVGQVVCIVVGAGTSEDDGGWCVCVFGGVSNDDIKCIGMGADEICAFDGGGGGAGSCDLCSFYKCTWG